VEANVVGAPEKLAPQTGSVKALKLNLGCGPVQPPGWVNVDGSNRAWLASRLSWLDRLLVRVRLFPPTEFNRQTICVNLLRSFPWANDSVDALYMGEILEHFSRADGDKVLRECFRVLKRGGIIRIRVPDNARFWGNYVEEYRKTKALPRSDWTLDHTRWIEMFFHDICIRRPLFGSMGHFHKWMYDEISLIMEMEKIGFRNAARMAYLESRIDDIAAVEVRDDLIVEATKE
jgi:predicted SAM-dependent methyltransferase